jgi:hypothetical protein
MDAKTNRSTIKRAIAAQELLNEFGQVDLG